MEILVREARSEDYDPLTEVMEEVDAYHRQALPHIFCATVGAARSRAHIDELISNEDHALFVAERKGQVIGVVHVALRETPDIPILVPRRYVAVDTLVVSEAHRRLGIGRALMERVQRWALDKGAAQIELGVWQFNQGAIAFYEKIGYRTTNLKMTRLLELESTL